MQKGPRIYVADSDDGLDAFTSEIGMPARRAAPAGRPGPDPLEDFEIQRPAVPSGQTPEPPASADWASQEPAADGRRLLVVGVIGFALTVGVLTLLVGPIWTSPPAGQVDTLVSAVPEAAPPADAASIEAAAPDGEVPAGTGGAPALGPVALGPDNAALPPLEEPVPPAAVSPSPVPSARVPEAPVAVAPRIAAPPPAAEVPLSRPSGSPVAPVPSPAAPPGSASPPTGSASPVGSPTAFGAASSVAAPPGPAPTASVPPVNTTPRPAPPPAPIAAPPAATPNVATAAPREASLAPPPIEVESAAIQNVLGRYRTAFNRLDVVGATTVWPTVDQGNLTRAFGQLEQQQVSFDDCLIEIKGLSAQAACRGTASYVPRVGSRTPRTDRREWTFNLRKGDAGWLINGVSAR